MNESDWYLLDRAGQTHGPYDLGLLQDLHARRELVDDTPVWFPGLARWRPARDYFSFDHMSAAAPPAAAVQLVPASSRTRPGASAAKPAAPAAPGKPRAVRPVPVVVADVMADFRPWQRLLALAFDLALIALLLSLPSVARAGFDWRPDEGGGRFLLLLVWAAADAALLSRWGTTPGRALFGLRVHAGGAVPLFPRALARSALIVLTGLGAGNRVLGIVLALVAYRVVRAQGQVWWDKFTGTEVVYADLSSWRRVLGVLALLALLAAILVVRGVTATWGTLV